jgi:hypothetical protein
MLPFLLVALHIARSVELDTRANEETFNLSSDWEDIEARERNTSNSAVKELISHSGARLFIPAYWEDVEPLGLTNTDPSSETIGNQVS